MNTMTVQRRALVAAIACALCCANLGAQAADKDDAKQLVERSHKTVEALAKDSAFNAMRAALRQAKGVLVFPEVVKLGFVLGGSGGTGVLLVRDAANGQWVGPAFYTVASASLGLQAGVSTAEMVMVVNSQKALDSLYSDKLKLGGDATVALGRKGMEKGAAIDADFVVYSKVKGAFAGLAVDGSVLDVRDSLNAAYYGQTASPVDILVKRSVTNPDAARLRSALAEAAK